VRVELLVVAFHELAEGALVPFARCVEELAFAHAAPKATRGQLRGERKSLVV
jgi:hypothetical protein